MPPLNGNVNQCNTESCKRCRNKYNCSRYVNYLEDIVNSPISQVQSAVQVETLTGVPLPAPADYTQILKPLSIILDSMAKIDEKFNGLFLKVDNIQSQLETSSSCACTGGCSGARAKSYDIDMSNDSPEEQVYSEESSLGTEIVVYDKGVSPLKKGDTYYEEKRTLFGGTKMVEKTVK